MVRRHGLASKRKLWIAEWPSLWRFESHLKTYHEWLDEVCVTLAQGDTVRTVCPGLGVLEFKYSAAPTRCTIETAVGTGLPNHCLHQPNWFYFLNPFISSSLCWVFVHICVWRLWLKTFSISSILFFQSSCLLPAYPIYTLHVLYVCFISSWWLCFGVVIHAPEYFFRFL